MKIKDFKDHEPMDIAIEVGLAVFMLCFFVSGGLAFLLSGHGC